MESRAAGAPAEEMLETPKSRPRVPA